MRYTTYTIIFAFTFVLFLQGCDSTGSNNKKKIKIEPYETDCELNIKHWELRTLDGRVPSDTDSTDTYTMSVTYSTLRNHPLKVDTKFEFRIWHLVDQPDPLPYQKANIHEKFDGSTTVVDTLTYPLNWGFFVSGGSPISISEFKAFEGSSDSFVGKVKNAQGVECTVYPNE